MKSEWKSGHAFRSYGRFKAGGYRTGCDVVQEFSRRGNGLEDGMCGCILIVFLALKRTVKSEWSSGHAFRSYGRFKAEGYWTGYTGAIGARWGGVAVKKCVGGKRRDGWVTGEGRTGEVWV